MDSIQQRLSAALEGRYHIRREAGGGATALLFVADDLRHGRRVAVKVLRPEVAAAVGPEHFHREIRVCASLSHPHILPLHDSGEADGLLFFVMPYVAGGSLADRLGREGPLPLSEALEVARETGEALACAHRHGVVHRDVKPANILISEGEALLADFGIARMLQRAATAEGAVEEGSGSEGEAPSGAAEVGIYSATPSGLRVAAGTAAYMSPEQASGEEAVDGRTDVYALGCVLHEMLAGEPPFSGPNARAVLTAHMMDPPPDIRSIRADVPDEVAEAIARALAKHPSRRFATAAEMVAALEAPAPDRLTAVRDVRDAAAARAPAGRATATANAAPVPAAAPEHHAGQTRGLETPPARWGLRPRTWPAGPRRIAAAFLGVGAVAAVLLLRPGGTEQNAAYAVANPRSSLVVFPFESRASSPAEEALTAELADALTWQLGGWEALRVVPDYAVAGPRFDLLGDSEGPFSSLDDGIRLAKAVRVGTLVALTVRLEGDSAAVQARFYDVASGEHVSRELHTRGAVTDVGKLIAPLALRILGLRGGPGDQSGSALPSSPESLRTLSEVPRALRACRDGLESLAHWRLADAARAFREAIAADPAFALPYHYLALTLYWQTAEQPERLLELGPEIARLTAEATRRAGTLGGSHAAHVQAFHNFWSGDYEGARRAYHEILARDSTDSWAWLLLGSVEFQDPWLAVEDGARSSGEAEGAALVPRSDLNVALRAFERAVHYSPDFQLGYGHLFDIYDGILDASRSFCFAFQVPESGVILPYDIRQASAQREFCPVMMDSIVWVATDQLAVEVADRASAEVRELETRTLDLIERWSVYAPEEPRPHAEWASWLLARREAYGTSAQPEETERTTREALEHTSRALALRGDTTATDLARLANLHLALGDLQRAVTMAGRARTEAIRSPGHGSVPREAANPFVATGRPNAALEIIAPVLADFTFAVPDPTDGRMISAGNIGASLAALQVYGATGAAGPPLQESFRNLRRTWSDLGYDGPNGIALRKETLHWVGPALLLVEPDEMDDWFTGMRDIPVVWQGLLAMNEDSAAARRALDGAVDALHRPGILGFQAGPADFYVTGVLAGRTGDYTRAVELFGRVMSWPFFVNNVDFGWGLWALSHLRRARAEEALGDTEGALRDYLRFVELYANAEPGLEPLVVEARQAVGRLAGGG